MPSDLESFVLEHDVAYVGGGRTRNMLALWREWGLVEILHKAIEGRVISSGVSAGGVCWFQQAVTMVSGSLGVLECLGFLDGSCCAHYDSQAARRSAYHQFVAQGNILPGFGIDDGVALHFVDGELQRVFRSRPEAQAYVVERSFGEVTERPLESTYLLGD
jgi:peptidase E